MAFQHRSLTDQVIVITGASSGIGLAAARSAAARGARVVLAARNGAALDEIAQGIRQRGGTALPCVTDVSRREDVERLADEALRAYGRIDTWVNNAGLGIFGRLEEISDADHRRLFDVNFWGLVHGSTVAVRHLKAGGGALVNLGSIASDIALPLQGMYSASKHAVRGYTDALRMELMEEGAPVTVTLVKPASLDTPFPEHAKNYVGDRPTLPPPVYHPQDAADAILYAAEHGPRDIYVGGGGKVMSAVGQRAPRMTDAMGAYVMVGREFREGRDADPEGALYRAGRGGDVRGDSPHHVMRSAYTRATIHPGATGAVLAGLGVAAAALVARRIRG